LSNHFAGLARGVEGTKISDFVTGTVSTSTLDVEVRIADTDQQGKTPTRKDIVLALKALQRWVESGGIFTTFPPL
jgi:hypothetical protein